jgi:hypothetical protein
MDMNNIKIIHSLFNMAKLISKNYLTPSRRLGTLDMIWHLIVIVSSSQLYVIYRNNLSCCYEFSMLQCNYPYALLDFSAHLCFSPLLFLELFSLTTNHHSRLPFIVCFISSWPMFWILLAQIYVT